MDIPLLEVNIPGIPLFDRGKIRDIFEVGQDLLVVTTDRVYLFDRVYPVGLAGKGKVLTDLTLYTFGLVRDLIPNYVITSRVEEFSPPFNAHPEILAGRSFLTEKVSPIRLECVVRGFLYGQAWKAYRDGDRSWLPPLPSGLELAEELPRPVFTPARKSRKADDKNLGWKGLTALVGEARAEELRELNLKIYERMRGDWAKRGFILADTKLEFGLKNGRLLLINEAGTPDCSRIWKESEDRPGRIQDSWDKDILENFLRDAGRSPGDPPIPIPETLLQTVRERFKELLNLDYTFVMK